MEEDKDKIIHELQGQINILVEENHKLANIFTKDDGVEGKDSEYDECCNESDDALDEKLTRVQRSGMLRDIMRDEEGEDFRVAILVNVPFLDDEIAGVNGLQRKWREIYVQEFLDFSHETLQDLVYNVNKCVCQGKQQDDDLLNRS